MKVFARVFIPTQRCQRPVGLCVVNNAGNIVSASVNVCLSHTEVIGMQKAGHDSCANAFVDYNRDCDKVLGDTCCSSSRSLRWSSVFSNDGQYFTSFTTSLVTLSGSNSNLSVTDMLSGSHQFDMSDMFSCSGLELMAGHNGSLLLEVNSYQFSGCDSSLKFMSGSKSTSLV